MSKQRIFSGIQPSGNLHIGNYLGAIKNWVKLQNEFDCIYCIVDLHAITIPQDPEELKKKTIEIAKILLASGIDPQRSVMFIQSHVQEHTELAWILNTITKNGDLSKMIQFKTKTGFDLDLFEKYLEAKSRAIMATNDQKKLSPQQAKDNMMATILDAFREKVKKPFNIIASGLYGYPVLMAADILLYGTDKVPVGEDQVQHVELTRTLAKRFNNRFGEIFKLPEPLITKEGKRIMGLDDPAKKMSKSAASEYNYIALTDNADTIRRKIKKAVTDSGSEIKYTDDSSSAEASKPALKNLINIYSGFSEKTPEEIEKNYQGKKYSDFKNDLAEIIIEGLKPIQEKMKSLSDGEILKILKEGAEKVRPIAEEKIKEVKEKMGFIL